MLPYRVAVSHALCASHIWELCILMYTIMIKHTTHSCLKGIIGVAWTELKMTMMYCMSQTNGSCTLLCHSMWSIYLFQCIKCYFRMSAFTCFCCTYLNLFICESDLFDSQSLCTKLSFRMNKCRNDECWLTNPEVNEISITVRYFSRKLSVLYR